MHQRTRTYTYTYTVAYTYDHMPSVSHERSSFLPTPASHHNLLPCLHLQSTHKLTCPVWRPSTSSHLHSWRRGADKTSVSSISSNGDGHGGAAKAKPGAKRKLTAFESE